MSKINLVVMGPVQVGKSIVLARIKQVLEQEFGITVTADTEVTRYSATESLVEGLAQWELDMIKAHDWKLTEEVVPN